MEKYEEAVNEFEKALKIRQNLWSAILFLIAAQVYTGQEDKAQARVKELLRLQPKFSIEGYLKNAPFEDEALKERLFNAWRKAGLK